MTLEELYAKAFDLLIAEVDGISVYRDMKETFVSAFSRKDLYGCNEWRISGCLGFGGKFRHYDLRDPFYVTMYPEDETPERLAVVEKINAKLKALYLEDIKKLTSKELQPNVSA